MSAFVSHVIQSLKSDPNAWELQEFETITWKRCDRLHPDAEKRWCKKGQHDDYDVYPSRRYWHWARPVSKFSFRLKHDDKKTVLLDADASDFTGWVIEKPTHVNIGWWASRRLSKAVRQWREYMLSHSLTKNSLDQKLLAEAYKELEEDVG